MTRLSQHVPRSPRWLALAVACIVLGACGTSGSGNLVSENRSPGQFEAISVSDGINLELNVDPSATVDVVVTYDDNLIDQIRTDVQGGELAITADGSFNIMGGGRSVMVSVPDLVGLTASGGSDVVGSGELDELDLEASGGADVDLSNLPIQRITVNTSGGADVTVQPIESVVGEATGGSNLNIDGNPDVVDVETSGGADVG